MFTKMKKILNNKGEVYIGEGAKIVICIVLGAAILAGLVLVTNKIVLPKTQKYFSAMFDKGSKIRGDMWLNLIGEFKEKQVIIDGVILMTGAIDPSVQAYRTECEADGITDFDWLVNVFAEVITKGEITLYDTHITREELDEEVAQMVASGNPLNSGVLVFIQLENVIDGMKADKTTMNNINSFATDYTNYWYDMEKGTLTEEQALEKLYESADAHGIPREIFY